MKIICIGRNYKAHIEELAHSTPSFPLFFLKPDSSILLRNRPFFIPDFSDNIHYEVELLVKICKLGKSIQEKFAHKYYDEIGLGIDFTARDLQNSAIAQGNPWELSKSFDNAAAVSKFVKLSELTDIQNINFSLYLNNHLVQQDNSKNMLFSVNKIISYVSQFMTLKTGDIIFTGTPSGVGKVSINDRLQGYIENDKFLDFRIK